jgi:hypothetical protein
VDKILVDPLEVLVLRIVIAVLLQEECLLKSGQMGVGQQTAHRA